MTCWPAWTLVRQFPHPINEPVLDYRPGSAERGHLEVRLAELQGERLDLTMTIGGQQRMGRGTRIAVRQPHAHRQVLGTMKGATRPTRRRRRGGQGGRAGLARRCRSTTARRCSSRRPSCLSGPWRATLNAATMLGQSKTAYQAEIDAACELIDFWRFNVHFAGRS